MPPETNFSRLPPPTQHDGETQGPARSRLRAVVPVPTGSDPADVAHSLYRATLDLLRQSDNPAADRHALFAPLSAAVAAQRTRDGILRCEELHAALAASDYDAALDACLALLDLMVAAGRAAAYEQPDAPREVPEASSGSSR